MRSLGEAKAIKLGVIQFQSPLETSSLLFVLVEVERGEVEEAFVDGTVDAVEDVWMERL